jgi:hypothetical protein
MNFSASSLSGIQKILYHSGAGFDLYLEACAATPEYQLLAELDGTCGYKLAYLSWLARQGPLDAVKRMGVGTVHIKPLSNTKPKLKEASRNEEDPPLAESKI